MKVMVLETRENGVALERGALKQRPGTAGILEIVDTRENAYNRIIKLARLSSPRCTKTLYEVHVLWINEDKMCLGGFERKEQDGKVVDYAQSWICRLGDQPRERDNQDMMPKRENWRH